MGGKSSNSLRDLGLGLSFVFGAFVLALVAELCYIFCWKSRAAGAVVIVDKSATTSTSRQYRRILSCCCCCCLPGGVCRRHVLLLQYWRRREPLPTVLARAAADGSSSSDAASGRSRSILADGTNYTGVDYHRPPVVHVQVDSKNSKMLPPPASANVRSVERSRSRGRQFHRLRMLASGIAWRKQSMARSICSVSVDSDASPAISASNRSSKSSCNCGDSAAVAEQPPPYYYTTSYNNSMSAGGLFPIREDSNEDVTSTSTVCDLEIVVEESPTSSCSHSTMDGGYCAAAVTSTSSSTSTCMYAASGAAGLIIAGHHRRRELRRASSNCSYFDSHGHADTQARRNSGNSSFSDIHHGRNYVARGAPGGGENAALTGEARDYKSAAAAARSMHSISAGALISSDNYVQQQKDSGGFSCCSHQNRAAAAHGRLEAAGVEERNPNVAADMARISLRLLFERSPINVGRNGGGGGSSGGAEEGKGEQAGGGRSRLTPEYGRQKLNTFFRRDEDSN